MKRRRHERKASVPVCTQYIRLAQLGQFSSSQLLFIYLLLFFLAQSLICSFVYFLFTRRFFFFDEDLKILFLSADCIEGQESRVFTEDYQSALAAMRPLGSQSAPCSGGVSFNATQSSSDSCHVFLQVHSRSPAACCLSGQEFLLAIFLSLNGWKIAKEGNLRDMTPLWTFCYSTWLSSFYGTVWGQEEIRKSIGLGCQLNGTSGCPLTCSIFSFGGRRQCAPDRRL